VTVKWPDALSEMARRGRWGGSPRGGVSRCRSEPGGSLWAGVVQQWGCVTCHKLDGPEKLNRAESVGCWSPQGCQLHRESILEPDAVVVEGFPPGLMKGRWMAVVLQKPRSRI